MAKLITESRTKPSGVLYAVINTSTLDALPVIGTDNGDGTSTLKVDTELTATIDPTGLATEANQPALEGTDKAKVSLYVKKSANADTVVTLGKAADADSIPVALSTEALAALETISLTGSLPDTNSSDLSGIHTNTEPSSTITEFNITLTVVDTEYHADLPVNCKGFEFVSRNGYPVRYAFTTGMVATPTEPYFTLKSNCSYESSIKLNLSSVIIYFATDNAGDVVELIAWS